MEQKLLDMLDRMRSAAHVAEGQGLPNTASYLEGKADGIAMAIEAMGVTVDPWKPRPMSRGWIAAEGPHSARF